MTKSISEKLYTLRKAKGLTQEKFGEMLGVSSQAVSKWEKADSLPDIMLISQICEILGITSDELLGVSSSVKQKNLTDDIRAYSENVGECVAAYEVMAACLPTADKNLGCAKMSKRGIAVNNTAKIAMVIDGEEAMNKIKSLENIDTESVKNLSNIISDTNSMKVFNALDFISTKSSESIADITGLSVETVESSLFKLMKIGICECESNGEYTLGYKSYRLLVVLTGFYLSSISGANGIGTFTCSMND